MCGLAGSLNAARGTPGHSERMIEALRHRGPDDLGFWDDPESGVALAHRRLSIIDTSPLGAQPMHSRSGRWVLAYNGEIYNHRTLRHELTASGTKFRGHSDTETLVEAIDAWGVQTTLTKSNGMFAFAAWDRHTHTLTLARDRLGEKPLYWASRGGRLLFASELKAFRALDDFCPEIDPEAISSLLRWSFIAHPATIYRNVYQLAPGHLIEASVAGGSLLAAERVWWSLDQTVADGLGNRKPTTLAAAAEELRPLLADAVGSRLESDVPLGSFLSGGIDSTIVAAFAQQALGATPLRTFTVKMPELGLDESVHAAAVARHLGTCHTTVELSMDTVLGAVPKLAAVWDEPFADPSMLPSLLLCQAARRDLSVCLAGDGGDEVFAGYNRHALGSALWRRVGWIPHPIRDGLGRALLKPSPAQADRLGLGVSRLLPPRLRLPNVGDKLQKAAGVIRADRLGLWSSLAQVWPDADLPGVCGAVPSAFVRGLDPIEEMMMTDTAVVLPDQMLVKVDRASMAASLEVRSPLLDHRLLEWAWRQPLDVRTKGGVGKLVLREVLDGLVPSAIVDRPKMGFDPPLATWLRGPLRNWAGDLVSNSRVVSNGWLNGSALERTWSEHQSSTRNHEYRLWAVLMLESWLDQYA
jgi:asparagine synthase (glutamine-hydrolysing)